jgi:hypothetical protein
MRVVRGYLKKERDEIGDRDPTRRAARATLPEAGEG